jgi:transposase
MKQRKRALKATVPNMHKVGSNAVMCCTVCGATYSANPSDYFQVMHNRPLTCCDEPCLLMVRTVKWSAA